jgi:O-antigen ligase
MTTKDIPAALTPVARGLVLAIPALLVIGKAPPDIAASLVALAFLVRSALLGDFSWARTPWIKAAFAVWIYLILASLAAEHMGAALGRAGPWIRFVLFAAALQFWLLNDAVWLKRLLIATGATIGFVAADTIFQYVFSYDIFGIEEYSKVRMTGPMVELPPKVGVYMMRLMYPVLIAVMFWAAASGRGSIAKVTAIAAICAGVTVVMITGERMPFLLALFGLGVSVLLVPAMRRIFLVALLAVGLSVAGLFALKPSVTDRSFHTVVSVVGNFWQSPYGQVWIGGLKVAQANPVIGVGLKNQRTTCRTVVYGSPDKIGPACSLHPHNFYIEWLAEAGSIGLFGFLVLITRWTRHFLARAAIWRSDGLAVGAVVAVITFLWPIAATMSFFTNWHAALFWFVLGWALAATGERPGASRLAGEPV